ncbi:TonB-dependent receptor plug domain-containing protein [Chryseobacterium sp.]|uniref:TonB-dependent receptor plug domain-containing protein n=1 Tax=Chryseobacterium sp. TaxID=1871047 RepID=UPI0025C2A589|nr:TonB-dependent receptor plug domain-containing protein [Chryseobacterium sp.]
MIRFLSFVFFFLFSTQLIYAQDERIQLNITVHNENNVGLKGASVIVDGSDPSITNSNGVTSFSVTKGKHSIKIIHSQYQEKELHINLSSSRNISLQLQSENKLEEVVITAREGKGLTSKSIINKQAMEHLQPSSFTDLLELLPGGLARDPSLTSVNKPLIRENTDGPSGYNTSSLGIQFMIDDNIWNSNADMQVSSDTSHMLSADNARNTTTTGVDMRTLSTNDIEKVEVIRGIPSAAYGDLTSGLIKIERKVGNTPLQARFKADGFSKQYYVSKGFQLTKDWQLTASADLLDAKIDPRNEFENYQRITASIRSKKKSTLWSRPLEWRSNLDLSNNVDKKKYDPDTGYPTIDKYNSTNTRISLTNNFIYLLDDKAFFNKITLNTAIRQGFDKIDQIKLVQQSGPRSISLATEQGENVGIFPALRYVSNFTTDGKPLDITGLFQINGNRKTGPLSHAYEAGIDWRYSKNNGKGQQYDLQTPPTATMTTRPRAYDDIPASQLLSAFLGDQISYTANEHKFTLYAGLRFSKQMGVDKSYSISKQVFTEPRINFQYSLPQLMINNCPLKTDITLGYGIFYKQPTLMMMYPNKKYWDYTQLNYYHNDEQYRYVNFMTYVQSLENKNITAAKNVKTEARLDVSYRNHNFFISYFKEDMKNGFRSTAYYVTHSYKQYDASQVDLSQWNNGPDLTNLSYTLMKNFGSYTITENGSATLKNGIEFGYSSPRIKSINTRFTLTGAWFRTQYRNTIPVQEKPSVSIGTDPFPYVGIYQSDYGYINSNLNYNLFIDTYLPNLDLTISASLQGTLFDHRKRDHRIAEPTSYFDMDGNVYTFTEADKDDIYKQWLVRNVSVTDNLATKYTFNINGNLKITKSIYKSLCTSMFVNRLFNYYSPYYNNGIKVQRKGEYAPYFGMELNYNF